MHRMLVICVSFVRQIQSLNHKSITVFKEERKQLFLSFALHTHTLMNKIDYLSCLTGLCLASLDMQMVSVKEAGCVS